MAARTLAELREWLRREIGDEARVSGSADSGSQTTLVDATLLSQSDDYWNNYVLNIESAGAAVPEGESKEILDFTNSNNTLTTEPFSAAIENGDSYSIAFFSNSQLNRYINEAIRDISRHRPHYTTAALNAVDGQKRYDFPTGARRIDKIEYINTSTEEEIDYSFSIEKYDKKIVFPGYWSESKALTVFFTKDHTALTSDSDTTTVEEEDEIAIILFAQALTILQMRGARYESMGELKPIDWARGQVRQAGGSLMQWLSKYYDDLMAKFQKIVGQKEPFVGRSKSVDQDVSLGTVTEYLKA